MEYFELVISQIIIFVIYAGIGVIAVKTGVLQEKSLDVVSKLVIKITLPVMLFHNTITGVTAEEFLETTSVMLWTVVMYVTLFGVSWLLKKVFRLKGDIGSVYQANTMFGNIGFMGIPVLLAFFPKYGMLYAVMFTVVDQLVLWTIGVHLTTPESKKQIPPIKSGSGEISTEKRNTEEVQSKKSSAVVGTIKKLINPATVAILLAVIGVFAGIKLPSELDVALSKVGAITSPLAMIYIGALFCYTDMLGSLKKIEFYGTVLVKMLLYPIAFYWFMGLFEGLNSEIRLAMTMLSAMPGMTSIAMLAKSQGSEGEYSAGGVFVTTLCSIVTLPAVCYITALM